MVCGSRKKTKIADRHKARFENVLKTGRQVGLSVFYPMGITLQGTIKTEMNKDLRIETNYNRMYF